MTRIEKHETWKASRQKRLHRTNSKNQTKRWTKYPTSTTKNHTIQSQRKILSSSNYHHHHHHHHHHHSYYSPPQGPHQNQNQNRLSKNTTNMFSWKRLFQNPAEAHLTQLPRTNNNNNNNHDNSTSDTKPTVDDITSQAFRSVIVEHLLDHSPCSLRDVLAVLRQSHWVAQIYQQQQHTITTTMTTSNNTRSSLSSWIPNFLTKHRGSTSHLYKNYEFILTLEKLEHQQRAHLTQSTIRSWEDAQAILAHVFDFQQAHEQALREHASIQQVRQDTRTLQHTHQQQQHQRTLLQKLQHITLATTSPELLTDNIQQHTHLDEADAAFCARLAQQEAHVMEQVRINAQAREAELEMQRQEQAQKEAQEQASQLLRPLTPEEEALVEEALYHSGPSDEIVASDGADSVQRGSLQRLLPQQWLNDEVIHYYMNMLAARDAQVCQQDDRPRRSHFFKSFFVSKLLNDGHRTKAGQYEYKNVKRWSKKVPGKDLFALDKVCFPINQGGMHWVCAVMFVQDQRICFYDSLGSPGHDYLEALFRYVQDEHQDKKGAPLPDADAWELVPCNPATTPRQLNGYDCGVFTCMFVDFVAKNCPLTFGQEHITQCRQRIALSILQGRAIL